MLTVLIYVLCLQARNVKIKTIALIILAEMEAPVLIKEMISNVNAKKVGLEKLVKQLIIVDLGLARTKEVVPMNLR